jgi:DNA-binding transcriptional LysR family regulator
MSDLTDIRIFLSVAEHKSFVAAARHLAMTAPSVTRAVGALEDELGVQLLLRTTRRVSLTSAGAAYAQRIGPLVKQFDEVAEEVREQLGETSGLVRINAPLSLGQQILPDIVSGFRVEYPNTAISLALTDGFIDIVSDRYDLAIRISEQPSDKSTIWRKICRVRRVLVASPGYLAAFGTPNSAQDLASHACLGYDEDAVSETWDLSKGDMHHKVRAGRPVAGNNGDLMARLAENGEGIAMLPLFIVEAGLSSGALVQVLEDWTPPQLWLTLYYPPYEKLPARVAKFSDFFESYVTKIRPL